MNMEDKLKEILEKYETILIDFEDYRKELGVTKHFFNSHGFYEEERKVDIEYDGYVRTTHKWRLMVDELKEFLNAWNS